MRAPTLTHGQAQVWACSYTHVNMCTERYAYTHTHIHAQTQRHTYMHGHIHRYIHTNTHTHRSIQIYAHTLIHIHTQRPILSAYFLEGEGKKTWKQFHLLFLIAHLMALWDRISARVSHTVNFTL